MVSLRRLWGAMPSMKNRHKVNWIKGFVVIAAVVALLIAVAVGVVLDGREAKVTSPPTNANSEFGFDVTKLSPELRAHAEACHQVLRTIKFSCDCY
jgi:uncharacterized protein YpmS